VLNTYIEERMRALGFEADCVSIGGRAKLHLYGKTNTRQGAEAVASAVKALTNGKTSIWQTGADYIVNVRAAGGSCGA
jgi:hypothetical protein